MSSPAFFHQQQLDGQYAVYSADGSLVLSDIETLGDARDHIFDLIAEASAASHAAFEADALKYVNLVRAGIGAQTSERLDEWRRWAEGFGEKVILADLTGDELAQLCDEELAGRHAEAAAQDDFHAEADAMAFSLAAPVGRAA